MVNLLILYARSSIQILLIHTLLMYVTVLRDFQCYYT
nr:MAG TPA: hypothetical protein [Bacteriophage sp.]